MASTPHEPGPQDTADGARDAFQLMGAGVPLSLLMDLAVADPHSSELLATEIADDMSWLTGVA